MAPQLEYEQGTTYYGAVDTPKAEERTSSRSNTLKLLVGMAFIAVSMTAAVFAFTSPAPVQGAVASTVNVDAACECLSPCIDVAGHDLNGVCTVAEAGKCVGFGGEKSVACTAAEKTKFAKVWTALGVDVKNDNCATCDHVVGQNGCMNNPCGDNGKCIDVKFDPKGKAGSAAARGFVCNCDKGFRGITCGDRVRVCDEWKNRGEAAGDSMFFCNDGNMDIPCNPEDAKACQFVFHKTTDEPTKCTVKSLGPCDANAVCSDIKDTPGKYTCSCNAGFNGDGYQRNQCQVAYGSILSGKCLEAGKTQMFAFTRVKDADKVKEFNAGPFDKEADAKGECGTTVLPRTALIGTEKYANDEAGWLDRSCTGATKKYITAGCADIDDCDPNPCQNEGTCLDQAVEPNDFKCTCKDRKYVLPKPFTVGGKTDITYKPYQGATCEKDLNECEALDDAICGDNVGADAAMTKDKKATGGCRNIKQQKPDGTKEEQQGFKCECDRGYVMGGDDGKRCVDKDNCVDAKGENPCKNEGVCTNYAPSAEHLDGHFTCECKAGLGWEGKTCETNIDECKRGEHTCGMPGPPGWQTCKDLVPNTKNQKKKFRCDCAEGFKWNKKKTKCVDRNECDLGPDETCGQHGRCINTGKRKWKGAPKDGWKCECYEGWSPQDGVTDCNLDIDECKAFVDASMGHVCHPKASCINTPGSWACQCDQGYSGDGEVMCEEIDDCKRYDAGASAFFCKADGKACKGSNGKADNSKCLKAGKAQGKCIFKSDKQEMKMDGKVYTPYGKKKWTCVVGKPGDLACGVKEGEFLDKENDSRLKKNLPVLRQKSGGKWVCDDPGKFCKYVTPAVVKSLSACEKDAECTGDALLKELNIGKGKWSCDKSATYTKNPCTQDSKFAVDWSPKTYDASKKPVYSAATSFIANAKWTTAVRVAAEEVMPSVTAINCKLHADCAKDATIKKWTDVKGGEWKCSGNGKCQYVIACRTDKNCQSGDSKKSMDQIKAQTKYLKDAKLKSLRCLDSVCVYTKTADVHQCGVWTKKSTTHAFSTFQPTGSCHDRGFNAFECLCQAGWTDSNCDRDVNECLTGTHECDRNAGCSNTEGSYQCECKDGYQDDVEACRNDPKLPSCGLGCHDIDDCTTHTPGKEKCVHSSSCTDLGVHAYRCQCSEGWESIDCDVDINECGTKENECHPHATCDNTDGSYSCTCNEGFSGDGIVPAEGSTNKEAGCKQIDDCDSNPCEHGKCVDDGFNAYHCDCDIGWTDKNCDANVNECHRPKVFGVDKRCDFESGAARCVDTPGSYYCRCISGYAGDGYTCTDLDDCDPNPCGEIDLNKQCGVDPAHNKAAAGRFACKGMTPEGIHKGEVGIGCFDMGANKYKCNCCEGWAGGNCCDDVDECEDPKNNECGSVGGDPNGAECENNSGNYECACAEGFWDPCECKGDTCKDMYTGEACKPGRTCNKCTECEDPTQSVDNGATYYCPRDSFKNPEDGLAGTPAAQKLRATARGSLIFPYHPGYITTPPSSVVTRGPGFRRKPNSEGCHRHHQDYVCENYDECQAEVCERQQGKTGSDSNYKTICTDTCGSFTCECAGPIDQENCWFSPVGAASGESSGCEECTVCGDGQYMVREATKTTDRICKDLVPEGAYVIESEAGSVAQCLVHWKQADKVFPERYNWGGRGIHDGGIKGVKQPGAQAADLCEKPLCGVCEWNGETAEENILRGNEAAWKFRSLGGHKYLILSSGDGKGTRCLGFQSADAPYPRAMWWKESVARGTSGTCPTGKCAAGARKGLVCEGDADCSGDRCKFTGCATGGGECKVNYCVKDADKTIEKTCNGKAKCGTGFECKAGGKCFGGPAPKHGLFCTSDADCGAGGFCETSAKCEVQGEVKIGRWSTSAANDDVVPTAAMCATAPSKACFCGKDSRAAVMAKPSENEGSVVWTVFPLGCSGVGCSKRASEAKNMFVIGQSNPEDGRIECLYFPDDPAHGARTWTHPTRVPRVVSDAKKQLAKELGQTSYIGTAATTNLCGISGSNPESALLAQKGAVFKLTRIGTFHGKPL